jgi:hypothetical protein
MKRGTVIVLLLIVLFSGFGLAALRAHKVLAQPIVVQVSIPTTWGKVVGVAGTNILFEASDGTIREVSLIGGQTTLVTIMKRS